MPGGGSYIDLVFVVLLIGFSFVGDWGHHHSRRMQNWLRAPESKTRCDVCLDPVYHSDIDRILLLLTVTLLICFTSYNSLELAIRSQSLNKTFEQMAAAMAEGNLTIWPVSHQKTEWITKEKPYHARAISQTHSDFYDRQRERVCHTCHQSNILISYLPVELSCSEDLLSVLRVRMC